MSLRRSFLQGVKEKRVATHASGRGQSDRRRFLSSLSSPSTGVSHVTTVVAKSSGEPSNVAAQVVSFDLKGILAFKDTVQAVGDYKKKKYVREKRPNYNNTRREMYANPEFRIKYLTCAEESFLYSFHWL